MASRAEIVSKAQAIFRQVLGSPNLILTNDLTAPDVEGWDSISHINLVVAVENAFAIRLTTAEVQGLNNVGDLIAIIVKKAV